MASVNRATIIGNLGADPEVRTLQSGEKVASIRIATTEKFKNKNGELTEQTEWHRVESWGRLAEIIEQYLKKGDQVYLEGKIRTEKYTDSQGIERYTTKIRVTELKMLSRKQQASEVHSAATSSVVQATPSPTVSQDFDEDLPF